MYDDVTILMCDVYVYMCVFTSYMRGAAKKFSLIL
jgi:hypothetical protein